MRKLNLMRFAAMLILALALSSAVSSFLLGKNMLRDRINSMGQSISVADYALNYEEPLQEQVENLTEVALKENARLTVIDTAGNVLADSEYDSVASMGNHLEREEIQDALEQGMGHATRYSGTTQEHLLYVAAYSEKGNVVLRMSVPYTNIFDYMVVLLPILLVGLVVAFVISVFFCSVVFIVG